MKIDQLCALKFDLKFGFSKKSESYFVLLDDSRLYYVQYQPFFTTDET